MQEIKSFIDLFNNIVYVMIPRQFIVNIKTQMFKIRDNLQLFSIDYYWVERSWFCVERDSQFLTLIWIMLHSVFNRPHRHRISNILGFAN